MALFDTINDGVQFEHYCEILLRACGYQNVEVTQASNDYGVDVTAQKDDVSYAIQCKLYTSPVGNSAVQEIAAGRQYYHKDIGVVMTNSTFTKNAITLAKQTGIKLWDGVRLRIMESGSGLTDQNLDENHNEQEQRVEEYNEFIARAIEEVVISGMASTSMFQRRMHLGWARACRLIDQLEEIGIIGPRVGDNPRQVLLNYQQWEMLREQVFPNYQSVYEPPKIPSKIPWYKKIF